MSFIETGLEGILRDWATEFEAVSGRSLGAQAVVEQKALLSGISDGLGADPEGERFDGPEWITLHESLRRLSASRAAQGESADITSAFVLSLKRPLFQRIQSLELDTKEQIGLIWVLSRLGDRMAQMTVSTYQRAREEIIVRQQHELLELSTPVIKLWDGVLAVPVIGTLDSSRSQLVMETLLTRIVETGAEIAIIDITGVPTVDTLVAQHLMKTVTAIRLMGADSIISGIRPQIAQTIVHLGIDLQGITTKATLADALEMAMKRIGSTVTAAAR